MSYGIEKWEADEKALAVDRQRMTEALARLAAVEVREPRAGASVPAHLVFVLDLTASREWSLKAARRAMAEMFSSVRKAGRIAVKLVYFRGWEELRSTGWESDPDALSRALQRLSCESGATQIARALRCVLEEKEPVSGVVFVGDHCEDDPGELGQFAAELGRKGVPVFVFHECADDDRRWMEAKPVFERLAGLSHGAYCPFGAGAAAALRELLATVAAFSAGGIEGVKQVPQVVTAEARQLQTRLLLGPGGGA